MHATTDQPQQADGHVQHSSRTASNSYTRLHPAMLKSFAPACKSVLFDPKKPVSFVATRPVDLLLHSLAEPLAIGEKLRPINVSPLKRRELILNRRADFPLRVPKSPECEPEVLSDIFTLVVYTFHPALNLR